MDELLSDLQVAADRIGLRGAVCVVAVSGGPDSVALWHLLCQVAPSLRMRLHMCHVDHGWRPSDAAREAAICQKLADAAGAGLSVVHLPAPVRHSEDAARARRLSVLERVARGVGASAVALAHHQDDQAETVLMQLVRGSAQAAGMPTWREPYWRPLLSVGKQRLLEVCSAAELDYSLDPTNFGDGNLRARLRAGVLPLLRRENPRVAAALSRNAALRAEDDGFLRDGAEALLAALPRLPRGVDVRPLRAAPGPLARRCLRELLASRGGELPLERTAEALAALREDRRMSPARGLYLEDGALWWDGPRPTALSLVDGMRGRFGDLWVGIGDPPPGAVVAPIPQGRAAVRGRRAGDRLATAAGTRKLQDLLVDAKVPRRVRDLIPILIIEGVPFWVPGQPWQPRATVRHGAADESRTAWAAPREVVASLWSVLK